MYGRDRITLIVPRYTKRRCHYCGTPINPRSRVCAAHRDLVIHDPLDARYRMPKDGKP